MAKQPNMKIGIGADTSDFEKGTKKVKQGLNDIVSESKAFGGALKSMAGTGAAAFAAVTAAVAGVISAVKDLSKQNQALGDAWERTCANMEGAFDSFKTAVANMDFTHLFSNMREAGRLAQELYDARDGLGEVSTSYNMSLARQMKTINDLKLTLQDTSKTEQERVDAGNKLLAIYEKLEQNPTRALSRISDASLDVVANKLGYDLKGLSPEELDKTRKYVENFFIWLGTEAGESWSSAYAAAFKDPSKLYQTTVNAQNAGLNDAYRAMLWNYQGAVGDKDREAMEQAVVAYYQQEAKYSEETFRIRKQIASINDASGKAGAKGSAAAAAAAKKDQEEMQRLLEAMVKRQENNERLSGIFDGITPLTSGVTAPKLTILPQQEPEYWKDVINAQLGDITIGIGFEADTEKLHDITNEVNSLISSGVTRSAELIGSLVGTLAGGGDAWGDFKNAALSAFGDMAIAVGKIAISAGLASEGIKAALKLDNPYVAIAAGAALIALGTAVKSSLSAVASGDYSAGGGAYASGGGYGSGDYETRDIQVNVNGTLKADGDELLAVINSTNKRNYYTQ